MSAGTSSLSVWRSGGGTQWWVTVLTISAATALLLLTASHGTAVTGAAQAVQAQSAPGLRLYVFDGGTLASDPTRYHLTKEEVATTDLSIAAYLVVHPKGMLMWDTGAVQDNTWVPSGKPVEQRLVLADGQERRVTITKSLRGQLASIGYAARNITHLALSHYHWDHTANANAFASATWLVRQVERDAMFGPKPLGTSRPETFSALKDSRATILTGDEHDVFGDGTVIIKLAPGHTEGHQVLFVKLAHTGGVVLSGDLYHYPQERTLNRLPTFDIDQEQTRASRRAVDAFLSRTGAQLWIQHDLTAHARLKKAPDYYD